MSDYYEVIPDPPVFDDATMAVVLPDHEGVEYHVEGEPADGVEVTVTATAADGWVFLGDYPTEWSHTFTEPEPEDEGPETPIPDPNENVDGSWFPGHGEYMSRNAGRRESLLEAAREIVNSRELADAVDPIADEVHNLGTVVADYGDQLERKVEPWAVPTVAPLSQTINRRADATVQLSDFMLPGGWSGTADGHRHPLGTSGGAEWSLGEGWTTGQRTYLAFITPAINRAYEEINFMVGQVADTSQPAANMDLAIYVADENRVLTSQIGTIRISDEIGPGRQLVTRRFPTWVATQGSYIAVAVRQWSGNTRPLLGLHDTPRPLSNVTFPRKITARWTSGSALPGTINGTNDLDFEDDWFTPYIELSESIGVDYRVFTEGWGHGATPPRPWVHLTPTGIWSGEAGNLGALTSHARATNFGIRVSMYDTPLSTDHVRVRSSVANIFTSSNNRATLIVRGTNDLRSGVGLSVVQGVGYQLISWSGRDTSSAWDNRTVVATTGINPALGDVIEVDFLDGLVDVRINGVDRLSGVSVGGPVGQVGRFVGVQTERTGNILAVREGPWLGPWSARDLPQSNGDEGEGEGGEEGEG